MTEPLKQCASCSESKPDTVEFFYRNGKMNKLRHECKPCRRADDTRRNRARHLKATYGLSLVQYLNLQQLQDARCAVCRQPERAPNKTRAVDHCHATGRVRGLLCAACNAGIGMLNDDPLLFRRASEYVTWSP